MTKIMMKNEREPFHKHDNWHNNIVHWKDSSCPTCIKEGIKQGYAEALNDVACLLRDLCFKKEGSKKLKLWCYDGIEAGKYDEIQEQIAKLESK